MAVHREHLQLHLELLQQAFGREQTLAVPIARPAKAPTREPTAGPPAPSAQPAIAKAGPATREPSPAVRPALHAAEPPPISVAATRLAALRPEVLNCTKCKLCKTRNLAVFGEGSPEARVLFIGEAPGANEDRTGRPFVGAAGQLLDRIINNAMGFERDEVFIANINKCRPPDNRQPHPDEVASCLPYLQEQVAIIRPEVIVCLGRVAAQNLLGRKESATQLRGLELEYEGIPVVVTWHPAYLLREPSRKRETWADIKRCNQLLGRPAVPPARP